MTTDDSAAQVLLGEEPVSNAQSASHIARQNGWRRGQPLPKVNALNFQVTSACDRWILTAVAVFIIAIAATLALNVWTPFSRTSELVGCVVLAGSGMVMLGFTWRVVARNSSDDANKSRR